MHYTGKGVWANAMGVERRPRSRRIPGAKRRCNLTLPTGHMAWRRALTPLGTVLFLRDERHPRHLRGPTPRHSRLTSSSPAPCTALPHGSLPFRSCGNASRRCSVALLPGCLTGSVRSSQGCHSRYRFCSAGLHCSGLLLARMHHPRATCPVLDCDRPGSRSAGRTSVDDDARMA